MRTVRIVTLNVGSLFEAHWDLRAPRIADALVRLAPDVVCLQEVAESSIRPNAAGFGPMKPSRRAVRPVTERGAYR